MNEQFKKETIERSNQSICDGSCEEHSGACKVVRVTDVKNNHDWGLFSYCNTAID